MTTEQLHEAARFVVKHQNGSTQLLQREFGYHWQLVKDIMTELERLKIVGPFLGSSPRRVLVTSFRELEIILENNSRK